jgi:hypothetical protein
MFDVDDIDPREAEKVGVVFGTAYEGGPVIACSMTPAGTGSRSSRDKICPRKGD